MKTHLRLLISFLLSLSASWAANAYVQKNLASDLPGVAGQVDANLKNPWALAASPSSPFWVTNNHTGLATIYDGNGQPQPATPLVVTVPAASGVEKASPTGQVFNETTGFMLSGGKPAIFLFASEDGILSGWNGDAGTAARVVVDNSAARAVYTGLALGVSSSGPRLYAANFSQGVVEEYDTNFSPVAASGGFSDPNLPPGFGPFGIQRIGQKLYVTYAGRAAGPGNGFINVFDLDGNLISRLVSQGPLNSPWGMALAPANFGDFSQALLVGNFGDGTINAFDSCSGAFLGTLNDPAGRPIRITGLWSLLFGNGKAGGDAFTLYFVAGIPGDGRVEDHGLFGSLTAGTPDPPAPSAPPADQTLNIVDFAFVPDPITIAVGTKVVWANQDPDAHTVTSDAANMFNSGNLRQHTLFSRQFNQPGTYTYHCNIHPFMRGTIIVK